MLIKDRTTLFRIAYTYNLSKEKAKALFQRKGLPMPFNPVAWNDYILAITRHPACPICGGPQINRPELAGLYGDTLYGLSCKYVKAHFQMVQWAPIRAAWEGITLEEAISKMIQEEEKYVSSRGKKQTGEGTQEDQPE